MLGKASSRNCLFSDFVTWRDCICSVLISPDKPISCKCVWPFFEVSYIFHCKLFSLFSLNFLFHAFLMELLALHLLVFSVPKKAAARTMEKFHMPDDLFHAQLHLKWQTFGVNRERVCYLFFSSPCLPNANLWMKSTITSLPFILQKKERKGLDAGTTIKAGINKPLIHLWTGEFDFILEEYT